ncbi:MAG TPA: NtaA/DmoA family FMN-dependent monooxygenase [Rhodopila sp.]|uniref:NtaA/DmoA family FMN-dependent monooxygenase n=1 Tax=Rhodopila sp. TaxID=2480087 RepID=UPI002B6BA58A|nr:NtaA/DmoA family FMN-dependent monooxygenase [Rhodopila sp.]HVY17273.1 NtaA/DmoA family FMN-dependent monooxygenase [Rhodopila sp.]
MTMSRTPFHLAWFISKGYGPKAWRMPWGGPNPHAWVKPDLFINLTQALERACFDYVMIEDSSNIPYTYRNSHDVYVRYACDSPKLDPSVLAPFLIQATSRIGVITTLSTTEYNPFLLARLTNALDHVSDGRSGWNVVTGSNDGGAQNFGLERQFPHDERYEMADEYVELVCKLWESWEPDAMVIDQAAEVFADPAKVHPVHHEGRYFRSRGPLSAPRAPQGRPVICQAGGSARGRSFAARWAETIIAKAGSVAAMKSFRDDVRARAAGFGRDPDQIKVLFQITPIVDAFDDVAQERRKAIAREALTHAEFHLASLSRLTGIDFSKFDLDEVLPDLKSNGHQTIAAACSGKTPRQLLEGSLSLKDIDPTGTPDRVAHVMSEIIEEVGGDGFLFTYPELTRRYITEIADGLAPALQKLGVHRKAYRHGMLRDHLLEY